MSLTPAHGVVTGPIHDLHERVNGLTIRLDRLQQASKLIRWIAMTAGAFALGSVITIASSMLGWARDDEAARADVRQLRQMTEELKVDIKELTRSVYSRRFGVSSPATATP